MTFEDMMCSIGVMKPNVVDPENLKQITKLEAMKKDRNVVADEKIDGCRYKMCNGRFFSSDNIEKTANFPHLTIFFKQLNMPNMFLDGEINYPGKTSQFCTRVTGAKVEVAKSFQENNGPIHYTIYDILRLPNGTWLNGQPWNIRRKYLEYFYDTYVRGTVMEEFIHLTRYEIDDKVSFIDEILASGGEGVVLKRMDSVYYLGKKPMWTWMKVKQHDQADLFIIGYKEPKKEYSGGNIASWPYWREEKGVQIPVTKFYYYNWIGAIKLGAYVNGEATHICDVSGLDENLRSKISEDRDAYIGKVVRVDYMETTEAGYPRHPAFTNFHETKTAKECVWSFNKEDDQQ